nr:hypothetical protein [Tanacetum cinerariifolium]
EDFEKRFVSQQELSAEQNFWLQSSDKNSEEPCTSNTPVKTEVLSELPKYFQNEHYALWEVIEFGDSYQAPPEETGKGSASESSIKKKGRIVSITTEDMQKRRNDVKGAILKTFGGNEATKKTKKNQLKQQYGNFKAEGSETLEQTFNRLQAIVSHLEFIDVEIKQDDLNQKFLTSLAPEWLMYIIMWRNRDDLDIMSLDDVYNHLKVYEPEVQKKSETNSQNMAFISLSNTSSGKSKVHTASVPTASTQVSTASTDVAAASISHDISYMANEEENHALVADEEGPTEFTLMAKSRSSLSQVEARLVEFKTQEIKFYEKIRGLERDVEVKNNKIENLINELEQVKKEKERLDNKLTSFESASKDLDTLLRSQRNDKNKEADCPKVFKTNKIQLARKSPVKYAEMYKSTSKSPKVRGKPHGKLIWKSIQNGPTPHPQTTDPAPEGGAVPLSRNKRDEEFTEEDNRNELADIQTINILSQGLPRRIFNILNQNETGREIWNNMNMSTVTYVELFTYLRTYKEHALKSLKKKEQSSAVVDPLVYLAKTTPTHSTTSHVIVPTPQSSGDSLNDAIPHPIQRLMLWCTTTNLFEANHEDAYDYDVDEGPHASAAFMANLSSTGGTNGSCSSHINEVQISDDSFFSDVSYMLAQEMQQEEHLNSEVDSVLDDNMITYDEYQNDSGVEAVPTMVSADEANKQSMIAILQRMHTEIASYVRVNDEHKLVNATLTAELERCKIEMQALERNKVKHDLNMAIVEWNKQNAKLEEENVMLKSTFKSKVVSIKNLQQESKHVLSEKKTLEDKYLEEIVVLTNANKVATNVLKGYSNPRYGKQARIAQPALYDGHVLLIPNHPPTRVYDSEESLVHAKVCKIKIDERPGHALPINYAKLNALYDQFVP